MTVKKELLPKNTRGTALIAVVQNCERKGEPALLPKASALSCTALG